MAEKSLVCWKCGASLKGVPRPITHRSNCPECYAELHVCVMCKSYDTRYTNKCDDERADPPIYKDTANFCEFFKPKPGTFDAGGHRQSRAAQAELKALFGEGGKTPAEEADEKKDEKAPKSEEQKAREELEKLFKK